MLKRLKIPLLLAFAVLTLSAAVYLTVFGPKDLKQTILLNVLMVLVLTFSALVIYRNYKEIHSAKEKARFWKEKAMLENEAKRSKNYIESILSNSLDLICLVKKDSTISYTNSRWQHVLDYSPEQVQGKHLFDFIPEQQKAYVMKKWGEMISSRKAGTYQTQIMKADETPIDILLSHSYIKEYDEFLISLKDISEQIKLQKKVQAIHELNRRMVTFTDEDQITHSTLQTIGKILDFDFCDFLLFDEKTEELVVFDTMGDSPHKKDQRIPLDGDNRIATAFVQARAALNMSNDMGADMGEEGFLPTSFKEGSELCIPVMTKEKAVGVIVLSVIEYEGSASEGELLLPEMASQVAVAIENTRLTKTVMESEEKYRTLVDNINIGIALISHEYEILSLNSQMKRWFPDLDLSKKPICYQSYHSPAREEKCDDCPIYETLQDGQIHESISEILLNGETKNLRIVSTPLKDQDGQIIAAIEMIQDITKQKKMETELRESEGRFRKIFDTTVDGILLTNLETNKFYSANSKICEMLGYSEGELNNLCIDDIHPEDHLPHIAKQFVRQVRGDITLAKDIPMKRKDGSLFYADINSVPITLKGGSYLLGSYRDVTERKRIEDLIKRGKEQWERTFDSVPDLIALVDNDHKITRLNKTMADRLGMTYQNIIGKPCYELLHGTQEPPEDCPHRKLLNDAQTYKAEIYCERLRGNFSITTSPLYGEEGELIGSVHLAHDITQDKKMEKELRESEERFRTIFDMTADGILVANIMTKRFFAANNRICEMLGYSLEEIINLSVHDIHPEEDLPYVQEQFESQARGELSLAKNIPMKRKDGTVFYADINASPYTLRGEKYLLSSFRDVTKSKEKEELIKKAKKEWERTFDSVPDLIALVDREHKITRPNKALIERLGLSYQEVVGKHCYEVFHDNGEVLQCCPHATEAKEQQEEIYSASLGGYFLVTTSPLYEKNGDLIGSVHLAHDITERKKAEKALTDSEEKYRGVVEGSILGIFIIQDGLFRFVNDRFCKILNYGYEEIVSKLNLVDLTHPDDRPIAQKYLVDLINGAIETAEVELKSVKKDGEIFPVRLFARTIHYLGKPAIMGSILDLSKEKTLELQLIRSQKMESLGQLAGGIAHDFNNILGITAGSLSILQNSAEDARSRKLTDMAMNAVERGSEIVKRLLLFSRADVVDFAPVSLPIVIDEAIKILEHTLEKNIIVQKVINNPSTVVMGSKEQLLQVILNLGVNARDAMQSGGVLNICLEQTDAAALRECFPDVSEGRYCAIHISDNGSGMDEETKKNIFDPFFTTKERNKGTGLGLSIVHGIIKRHNGLIDVQSTKEEGTTFSVYLPLAPVLDKSEMTDLEKEELKGGNEKIFIIEDEDSLREVLRDVLSPLGYEIIEAKDGEEAIHIYEEKASSIDLIILDIGMPKIQGDEVFQRIKEINPGANVLVASGYLEHETKSKLLSLGVKEFIQKPYSLREVALTVRNILDSRQQEALEIPSLV